MDQLPLPPEIIEQIRLILITEENIFIKEGFSIWKDKIKKLNENFFINSKYWFQTLSFFTETITRESRGIRFIFKTPFSFATTKCIHLYNSSDGATLSDKIKDYYGITGFPRYGPNIPDSVMHHFDIEYYNHT